MRLSEQKSYQSCSGTHTWIGHSAYWGVGDTGNVNIRCRMNMYNQNWKHSPLISSSKSLLILLLHANWEMFCYLGVAVY